MYYDDAPLPLPRAAARADIYTYIVVCACSLCAQVEADLRKRRVDLAHASLGAAIRSRVRARLSFGLGAWQHAIGLRAASQAEALHRKHLAATKEAAESQQARRIYAVRHALSSLEGRGNTAALAHALRGWKVGMLAISFEALSRRCVRPEIEPQDRRSNHRT